MSICVFHILLTVALCYSVMQLLHLEEFLILLLIS